MSRPTKKEQRAKEKAKKEAIKAENEKRLNKAQKQPVKKDSKKPIYESEEKFNNEELKLEELQNELDKTNEIEAPETPVENSKDIKIPENISAEPIDEDSSSIEAEDSPPSDYEIPEDEFDPLDDEVVKRSYTSGVIEDPSKEIPKSPSDIPSDTTSGGGGTTPPKPPVEEYIAEPEIKTGADAEDTSKSKFNIYEEGESPNDKKPFEKVNYNEKLDDLSPSQKRKAAEKTADALITTYSNLLPIPFKAISSFKMRKLERLHMNNELDLNMQVLDDGTRVRDYCENVNEQVDKTFIITDDMKAELKEPLVDVLLEHNFALTPTQRLLMVGLGQILQMGITAVQFLNQNKQAISTFKQFHEDNKGIKKDVEESLKENNSSNRTKRQEPEPVVQDIPNEEDEVISKPSEKGMGLSEFLDNDNNNDDSITITEEPNE